jgi:small nuclear ribonucleoprotein (snRNP)-like protein
VSYFKKKIFNRMQANDTLKIMLLLTAFCGSCLSAAAQSKKGEKVVVQTFDGNEFQGELLEDVVQKVVLQTKILGKVTIEPNNVKSIRLIEGTTAQPVTPTTASPTLSNPENAWVIVEARDGNRFEGELLEETDSKISLRTAMLGKITLNMTEVRSVRLVKEPKLNAPPTSNAPPTQALSEDMILVETRDDNQFIGIVDDSDPNKVVVQTTTMGKVSIQRNKIRRMQPLTATVIRTDDLWESNISYYRNIMTPTAIGMRKNEGNIRNTDILFTAGTYGFSKNWSAEVGFDLTSILTASQPNLLYCMPQYHKQMGPKTYMAFGAYIGTHSEVVVIQDPNNFFPTTEKKGVTDIVPFTTFTYGTTENNLTFGVGYRFMNGKLSQSPVVTVGGQYRLSRNWMLVGEVMNQKRSTGLRDPDNPEVLFPIMNFGVRYLTRRYVFDFGISRSKTFNQENNGGNTAPATTMGTRPILTVSMPFYRRLN